MDALETKPMTIEEYIEHKIKILDQMCIKLSDERKELIRSLKSEIAVDNFAHSIICKEDW